MLEIFNVFMGFKLISGAFDELLTAAFHWHTFYILNLNLLQYFILFRILIVKLWQTAVERALSSELGRQITHN